MTPALLFGAALLAFWELAVTVSATPPTLLPPPTLIARTLWEHAPLLARHTLTTLAETVLGFSLALVVGVSLALLIDLSATLRRALYPWLVALRTVPIVALAPLMLIWFGFGLLPKVLLVAFFCFFPIAVATTDGLARTDPELLNVFRSLRASRLQTLLWARWPSTLPSLFSGVRIAAAYSVSAAIFAEYVGGFAGLGVLI
jgi:ABC-type nitrate/sulfonate/bicarbonate transport system permease component